MRISWYIFLTFLLILLLFSVTTYINFRLSGAVIENEEYSSRSTLIIRDGGRFQRNVLTMVNGLRGYLLTGEKFFIEAYDSASTENDSILVELSSQLTDSSQSLLLKEIKALNDQWKDEFTDPLKKAKNLSIVSPKNLDSFNNFYRVKFATGHEQAIQTALKKKFRQFTNSEYNIRESRKKKLSTSINKTRRESLIFTILSVVAAIAAIAFLVIKISRRLRQMTIMANDIAVGNYAVSIQDKGNDELSSLGQSLNYMAGELSKNISLLQRSNEELDQFAYIVSHDLKGPLRGISNVVTWLEEDHNDELSPKTKEYLDLIKGRVAKAESLIGGVLSYARVDKEEMEKETVNLNKLVEEILENLPDYGHIRMEVLPLPTLYTEKLLLYQVFYNLINNALKYNDKADGAVMIYCKEYADCYEFFIRDNGIGIAESYHKRIFVIFQTLRDEDVAESTGVGLAIVKKILDGKKQKISLQSEPAKGSTFSFTWAKK